jgi:PAS domain S-box-containing protein
MSESPSTEIKSVLSSLRSENEQLRRQLERARATAHYAQLVFENSLDAIIIADDDGRYLDVNQAAVELFGFSVDQFLKMRVSDIQTWEGEEKCPEIFEKYLQADSSVGEFRFIDAGGRKRIARYSAQRIGPGLHRSIMRDVTDQRARDEQLRLLTKAVQNSNDAIIITEADPFDEPGPRILYVNEAFERMTGYRREEVLGRTPRILQGEKTDRAMLDRIRAALTNWYPVRVEVVNYRKDGVEFLVDLSLFPVIGEQGEQAYWIGVQRDVTEQREAEHKILESLKLKDMLLREIHHRIKNNLQLVSSLLELQLNDGNKSLVQPFVNEAQSRIEAMALVHEHLYENENPESVAMDEFIAVLVNHLHGMFRVSGINCTTKCDRVTVPVDMAIPLGLILNELVTNAIKHAFPESRNGRLTVRFHRFGDEIEVEVEDDGIGLPEDLYQRESASLGLRLVRLLTQQLKGIATFERIGQGTRTAIRAPLPTPST